MKTILPLLLCFCLTSCAWFGTHKAQLGATGSWLARKAAVLAVEGVLNAATSPHDATAKADAFDTLAAGFRTAGKNVSLTNKDVSDLYDIWKPADGPAHWDVLKGNIVNAYALSGGPSQQRLEAIAVGLNDAAQESRAEAAALRGP